MWPHGCLLQGNERRLQNASEAPWPGLWPSQLGRHSGWEGEQDQLRIMCEKGWEWFVIVPDVELAYPELPSLWQSALNASHSVAGQLDCFQQCTFIPTLTNCAAICCVMFPWEKTLIPKLRLDSDTSFGADAGLSDSESLCREFRNCYFQDSETTAWIPRLVSAANVTELR